MKRVETDVAVIGAGSAGLSAINAARRAGKRVVLIERGEYGTTCARVGCMPSKLLIAAAEAAHGVREANRFGVLTDDVRIDGRAVMARVRQERDRFVSFVVEDVDSFPAHEKITGEAHFVSDTVLSVGNDTEVHAKAVVIATGSDPVVPDTFKVLGDRAIVNDDVFDWEELPRRVAVFGPGVIGAELGQALARLGVNVKVFGENGSLVGLSDPEVRCVAQHAFQKNFYLDPDARVEHVTRDGDEVVITYFNTRNVKVTEHFDYALIATGRAPNLKALKLENTSAKLDKKGVPLFDRKSMQIGKLPIFIAGDVDGDVPFLHEAADEGRIAGDNAARFPDVRCWKRRTPLAIVFTDPQVAIVGQRFKAVADQDIVIGEVSFEDQGRARVMLQNQGLLRVYAQCGDGLLLGAEMAAPAAEHLGHLLAWAIQQKMTVPQVLDMPFYHPVLEEGLRTALRDAVKKLKNVRQDREAAPADAEETEESEGDSKKNA